MLRSVWTFKLSFQFSILIFYHVVYALANTTTVFRCIIFFQTLARSLRSALVSPVNFTTFLPSWSANLLCQSAYTWRKTNRWYLNTGLIKIFAPYYPVHRVIFGPSSMHHSTDKNMFYMTYQTNDLNNFCRNLFYTTWCATSCRPKINRVEFRMKITF